MGGFLGLSTGVTMGAAAVAWGGLGAASPAQLAAAIVVAALGVTVRPRAVDLALTPVGMTLGAVLAASGAVGG